MSLEQKQNSVRALTAFSFVLGTAMALCFLLPFWLVDGKPFIGVNDSVHLLVPLNVFTNESVKTGEVFWDWYSDLGGSFTGNYAFYTAGSPFVWLTLLLPAKALPAVMPFVLALKYGVASAAAFYYVQRFLEDKRFALIGAFLYAFSGFQATNLVFYHFHDATAFFPLLLSALEDKIEGKENWLFSLTVALNAFTNFFFFCGEALFCVLYFCFRTFGFLKFRAILRKTGRCLLEGCLGIGLAAVIFLPGFLYNVGNPRASETPYGLNALFFEPVEIMDNIKAYLFANEAMNWYTTLRPEDYSSTSLFLPFTGILPALLYIRENPKSWLKRLLLFCAVCSFVPVLNAAFVGFTFIYYRRWYYMFLLVLALAVTVQLESRKKCPAGGLAGWYFAAFLFVAVFLTVLPRNAEGDVYRQSGSIYFVYQAGVAFAGAAAVLWLMKNRQSGKDAFALLFAGVVLVGTLNSGLTLCRYRISEDNGQTVSDYMAAAESLSLPEDKNYRILSDEQNLGLYMRVPSVSTWNSAAHRNIFNFYEAVGLPRWITSDIRPEHTALKLLLSVRYDILNSPDPERACVDAYEGVSRSCYVYENERFLPLGFAYRYYLTEGQLAEYEPEARQRLLLKAAAVREEDVEAVSRFLTPLPEALREDTSEEAMEADYRERKARSSTDFTRTTFGFRAVLQNSEEGGAAYFSVPYDKGWSASVNGSPVPVYSSAGMMCVPLQAGENIIEFQYFPRETALGAGITVLSTALLLVLSLAGRKKKKHA